ncbi:MAG: hypothetical protein J7L66_02120, partial [Anaerolineaceae bacterium]|nr:hypothetical protein [Anaerolineaceae bacterium]
KSEIEKIKKELDKYSFPEALFTRPDGIEGFLSSSKFNKFEKEIARLSLNKLIGWQNAMLLPIDEIIITIGAALFEKQADLAMTHKIAMVLKKALDYYPYWQLPEFCNELEAISKNKYHMYGFSEEDLGFDPDQHKGEVVVSTIHKAKGLEWDRVYVASVNNYNFPSGSENDVYYAEKWFVKGRRNLEAETVELLKMIIRGETADMEYSIRTANMKARNKYCAERLRLLYVAITRAREELIITWNTGKNNNCTEAVPLRALRNYLIKEKQ